MPFYVRTGCAWQSCELAAIERFLGKHADCPDLSELVVLDMPLADLYGDHWSISGANVPDDSTPDEAVYLPGRNPLLLIKPALWCRMHGIEHLALATLAGNPFRDATPEFFARFEEMLHEAMGGQVQIARPFERMTKESRDGNGPRFAARTYVLLPGPRRRACTAAVATNAPSAAAAFAKSASKIARLLRNAPMPRLCEAIAS